MPFGLASRVYRRRVPSPAELPAGTNVSPELASPTLPPEKLGPSWLVSSSTESVYPSSPNDAAHSAPKHRMHLPSGSPDPPKGVAALDRREAVHQHLLRNGEAVSASLVASPSACQAVRATSVQAPTSCRASVHRSLHRCSPRSSVATLARLAPRRPSPRRRPTILDSGNPAIALLSLSILSVGYTNTVDGCPPSASARQR
jgi:hypothetical protein